MKKCTELKFQGNIDCQRKDMRIFRIDNTADKNAIYKTRKRWRLMKEKCMKRGRKWFEIENIKEIFVRTHWD
jgi:phosphorylcholine metabolism protein LicD